MKKLLLLGPLLWFRRVVFWILLVVLILVFIFYILANSSMAVKKVVDRFAPDYNITYESIQGNVWSGFEIKNPQYNHQSIAKELRLNWNPDTLANREIHINKLHVVEANIEVIKALASQFSSEDNNSKEDDVDGGAIGLTIDVEDIKLSTLPFELGGIDIASANLQSKALRYGNDSLELNDINLSIESNVSNISLQGEYIDGIVSIENLKILELNLTAIIALLDTSKRETKSEKIVKAKTPDTPHPLMPTSVKLNNLEIAMLYYKYKHVEIDSAHLMSNNIFYSMQDGMLSKANVELNASSNLTKLVYKGNILDNHLLGKLVLYPEDELYSYYNLSLRRDAIKQVDGDLNITLDRIMVDVHAEAKQLLLAKDGDFNFDVNRLDSRVIYDLKNRSLLVDSTASVTTPYTKNIAVKNHLVYAGKLEHSGEVVIDKLEGIATQLVKPLENLVIHYSGDSNGVETDFSGESIEGYFNTPDFKKGTAHIETKGELQLSTIVSLPEKLQDAKAKVIVDAPLNLRDFATIDAKVKVTSNIVNIDANVKYSGSTNIEGTVVIPKMSLLKTYNEDVVWESLSPMNAKVKLEKNNLVLALDAKAFKTNLHYGIETGALNGKVDVSGLKLDVKGNTNNKVTINTDISSMSVLNTKLNTLYPIGELPPIEGDIDATIIVDKMQSATLKLTAPNLLYKVDRKTKHTIKDVELLVFIEDDMIHIKSYNVVFNKEKYFATKTSKIRLGDTIEVADFWLNDTLKVTGKYSPEKSQGKFKADATRFHIKDKIVDIYSKINLNATIDGEDTTIEGKVILLEGLITPSVGGRTFATDSDIIFVQEMKKNKKSTFMDNLVLRLKIETKKPLKVRQKGLRMKLKPDFTINKEKMGDMLYLGSVDLLKGSSYVFQDKKFVLAKSAIYFVGDVNKPMLDIKAKYQSLDYLITIAVTGTPAEPSINFSSSPSLTREQILSVILFDNKADGNTHSGDEMMRMMGGAMAKSVLSNMGVKVDHLAFGEGNSIEVGKKLSSKTTVIYINGEVPKVKLKYQHNKRTESVIGVSKESQSYDIIYKRDF